MFVDLSSKNIYVGVGVAMRLLIILLYSLS